MPLTLRPSLQQDTGFLSTYGTRFQLVIIEGERLTIETSDMQLHIKQQLGGIGQELSTEIQSWSYPSDSHSGGILHTSIDTLPMASFRAGAYQLELGSGRIGFCACTGSGVCQILCIACLNNSEQ